MLSPWTCCTDMPAQRACSRNSMVAAHLCVHVCMCVMDEVLLLAIFTGCESMVKVTFVLPDVRQAVEVRRFCLHPSFLPENTFPSHVCIFSQRTCHTYSILTIAERRKLSLVLHYHQQELAIPEYNSLEFFIL